MNEQKHTLDPWAACRALKAENARLTVEIEALKSQRGISALLAADRTQRERELIEENSRLREANRRLQAEGPALERDKLITALRGENGRLSQELERQRTLTLLAVGGWKRNFAKLAAAEEALRQARRESKGLRYELEAHKRFHAKVGCPGVEDCYVCSLYDSTEPPALSPAKQAALDAAIERLGDEGKLEEISGGKYD